MLVNRAVHRLFGPGVVLFCAGMLLLVQQNASAATPEDYAVKVSATSSTSPASITLSWPSYGASSYNVYRKANGATSWNSAATLSGSATSWTDTGVSVGSDWEYKVVRNASPTAYGYVYAGCGANMKDGRGKVLLVVDNTMAGPLSSELSRLQLDLLGDGWTVQRIDVSRTDSVSSVKSQIRGAGARSVFLFGHVPVPYSGDLAPDGHTQHVGAWPADVYYGDGGSWTDSSVNDSGAQRPENRNVPGDGKFDQSTIPNNVDYEIGRVDLSDMGTFGKSETELLRQYLDKDHAFRHGQWSNARAGVVDDNFGDYNSEAFASNGWRNFAPLFGASNVVNGDFFSGSYLWGYGTGAGDYTSSAGVASTGSFASGTTVVFTMLFGSYFGDWNSTNNFLRAPLCAPSGGLSCSWSARPYWQYHHMGLGEPIGYSAKVSQNNSSVYYTTNKSVRGVHMALMGDPTLRLHAVKPVSNLTATSGGGVQLSWSGSSDSSIAGYHIYRSSSTSGPFSRLTSSMVTSNSYTDSSVSSGTYTYMVRAVKLESCGSGTYYNPSQGIFVTANAAGGGSAPAAPSNLSASASGTQITLSWSGSSGATSYKIKRSTTSGGSYTQINTSTGTGYTDTGLASGTTYYYVVTAANGNGESGQSNQASATTAAAMPGTPTNLACSAGNTQVSMTWSASSNASSYKVKRSTTNGGPYSQVGTPSGTSYTDTGLSNGTTYYYVVTAANSAGESSSSNQSSAAPTAGTPVAPTNLACTAGNTQISLSWSASANATGYKIKRSTTNGGSYSQVGTASGTSYTDTGLTNGTTYYYVVTATNSSGESSTSNQASATPTGGSGGLPAPWVDKDIGSTGIAGSATYAGSTFTVIGAGADIWDAADAFNYVYQPMTGDGTIVARVTGLMNTDPWAKAGVMIRDGLNANSAHAMTVVSIANGTALQYRSTAGGNSSNASGSGGVPYWVKLVRAGNTFTSFVSSNGTSWTQLGTATISMAASVNVGLAVTAHKNGVLNTATFDNVTVTAGSGGGGGGGGGGTVGGKNGTPYLGAPVAIPGKIEAENYNLGGEGVAYHDLYSNNEGGKYRQEGVDLGATTDVGGGYYIGWVYAGEWTAYEISAATTGAYTFTLRTATTRSGVSVHLELDGVNVGSATVTNTGGWESWAYTNISNVNVNAGTHTIKLVFDTDLVSVNYINVTASAAASRTLLASVGVTPNPAMAIQPVDFNAAAAPADDSQIPVSIVWDFGDGTYDVGDARNHVYTAAGQYSVRVTAMDGAGNAEEKMMPLDVGGGLGAGFTLKRVNAGLVFKTADHDSLRVDAMVVLPADTVLAGSAVTVNVGGVAITGTLDAKGRAKVQGGTLKLVRKRGDSGETTVSLSVQRASVLAALTDDGVANEDAKNKQVSLPVVITIGESAFSSLYSGFYTARSGKTGRVR